jgi:hypothetical protein
VTAIGPWSCLAAARVRERSADRARGVSASTFDSCSSIFPCLDTRSATGGTRHVNVAPPATRIEQPISKVVYSNISITWLRRAVHNLSTPVATTG